MKAHQQDWALSFLDKKNAYGMHHNAQKLNNSMFLKKKLAAYTTGSKHLESGSAPPPQSVCGMHQRKQELKITCWKVKV